MEHTAPCNHPSWDLLNPWEYARKYQCASCGGVAICECDQVFVDRFPYQAEVVQLAADPLTELPVSLGVVEDVCPSCRGEIDTPYPHADGWGSPRLIDRYYWREIAKEAYSAHRKDGFPPKAVWKAARQRIKDLHDASPKYALDQHDRGHPPENLEEIQITGEHVVGSDGVGRWMVGDDIVRVEELAARWLRSKGWEVLTSERYLPAGLFATFMGLVVQDPADEALEHVMFGKRDFSNELVDIMMPRDHHTPAWFSRRKSLLRSHISELDLDDWEFYVEYWWDAWSSYREYLWVESHEHKDLLRWLFEWRPERARATLLYLAENYWGRYTGWPDLMARRCGRLRLFEVKSPNDRLSEDQIRWFNDNDDRLGFDVAIIRVRNHEKSSPARQ